MCRRWACTGMCIASAYPPTRKEAPAAALLCSATTITPACRIPSLRTLLSRSFWPLRSRFCFRIRAVRTISASLPTWNGPSPAANPGWRFPRFPAAETPPSKLKRPNTMERNRALHSLMFHRPISRLSVRFQFPRILTTAVKLALTGARPSITVPSSCALRPTGAATAP